jgi:hypothetical protein
MDIEGRVAGELAVRRRARVRHRLDAVLPEQLKEFFP